VRYKSSLIALLEHARAETGRDPETGAVVSDARVASWLGAVAYIVLLDQIGSCFLMPGKPATDSEKVIHALRTFTNLSDDKEIQALYALRCAFAHDFCLFNRDHSGKHPDRQHAFNLGVDPSIPLIQLPKKRWSGDYSPPPPPEEITFVNLRLLGDLVEEIVANLRARYESGTLDIRMKVDDFHVRYQMMYAETTVV
jgi:hypothetical protein